MADMAMTIRLLSEPAGWMWQELKPLIEEGQAACLGNRTYEFHTYGDGGVFQARCDHLGVEYDVTVESDD
jgi:hypothetical protein